MAQILRLYSLSLETAVAATSCVFFSVWIVNRMLAGDMHTPTCGHRIFGEATCRGCLAGILGSQSMSEELCNSTLPHGQSLETIAKRFGTTSLALWSLNSGEAPDGIPVCKLACRLPNACRMPITTQAQRLNFGMSFLISEQSPPLHR